MNHPSSLLLLADAPAQQGSAFGAFVPMILIIAIFYFLMIRPQQRREKERRAQIAALRAGTRVLFCGGLFGTVEEVRDATFLIRVDKNVVLEVAKGAVERPLPAEETSSGKSDQSGKESGK